MRDLIDRQTAIDAVMRNACNTQRIYEAIKALPSAQPEPKTVRDTLNSMTDDEFAEWLCHQIFPDYDEDDVINVMRHQSVRNFLKMDIKQT